MNKTDKKEFILWIKRLLGFLAIALWLFIIFEVSQMPVPFMEQAPYCVGGTMMVFGILTVLHKGLDYWMMKGNR